MTGERWKGVATKTGPNDARRVVWAISKFYFVLFHVLPIITVTFRFYEVLKSWGGSGKPAVIKTGPNDASGVVWALSKYFF